MSVWLLELLTQFWLPLTITPPEAVYRGARVGRARQGQAAGTDGQQVAVGVDTDAGNRRPGRHGERQAVDRVAAVQRSRKAPGNTRGIGGREIDVGDRPGHLLRVSEAVGSGAPVARADGAADAPSIRGIGEGRAGGARPVGRGGYGIPGDTDHQAAGFGTESV